MRRSAVPALVLALVLLPAVPAAAAPALSVDISVNETLPTTVVPFLASGPAVDAGVVCGTGTVETNTLGSAVAGNHVKLDVEKVFTCAGGGTFTLRLKVKLYGDGTTTAIWHVVGGTGPYAGLKGSGRLVGIPSDPPGTGILDVYDGKVKSN